MTVALRDMTRRGELGDAPEYPGCGACQLPPPGHEGYHTKHIRIDSDGYGLVSAPYWEDIKKYVDHGGFVFVNPVPEPPRQGIDFGANGSGKLTVFHKMTRPILAARSEN